MPIPMPDVCVGPPSPFILGNIGMMIVAQQIRSKFPAKAQRVVMKLLSKKREFE